MPDIRPERDWEPFRGDEEIVAGMTVIGLYVKEGPTNYEPVEATSDDSIRFNARDWCLLLQDDDGRVWRLKWTGDHPVIGGNAEPVTGTFTPVPDEHIPPDFLEERGAYEEDH